MAQNLNLNLIIGDLKALQTNVTLRLDGEPTNIAIKTQTKALQTKGIFSTEKGGKGKDNDPLKDLDKASKDIKDAIEELTKNEQKVGKAFEDIIKAAQDLRCIEAGPCGHVFGDECSSLAQAAMSLLNVFDWGRDGKLSTVVKNLRGSGSVISFSYEDDVKDIYDVSEDVLKSLEKLGCFELTTATTGQNAKAFGQVALSQALSQATISKTTSKRSANQQQSATPPASPVPLLCASLAQYFVTFTELIADGDRAQQNVAGGKGLLNFNIVSF